MKNRWKLRRERAIKQLGGCCVGCGSLEKLEFDHIDPSTKIKAIAKMSSASERVFQEELEKCQLLCYACHLAKHCAGS